MKDRDDILEEAFDLYEEAIQEKEDLIGFQEQVIDKLRKEKNVLQYKIDQLMLEFCPEEMTQEQIENWEQHQVVSSHSKNISSQLTCGARTGIKVTVESEINRLLKRNNRRGK